MADEEIILSAINLSGYDEVMAEYEDFSFVIPAFSPETMPLDRLIEYLQQLSTILGDAANLHLIKIEQSSTAPTFRVPARAALEAKERAAQFNRGERSRDQIKAYDRVRRMIRRDAPDVARPATFRSADRVLLEIPAALDETGTLSGLRQQASVDGTLVSLGGVNDASLRLQALDGQIVSGLTTSKALAKELARLIYEPVRLTGPSSWGRNEDGVWVLEKMIVRSFEALEDTSAREIFSVMTDLDVEWPADFDDWLALERTSVA